jgi:hypothetical protein
MTSTISRRAILATTAAAAAASPALAIPVGPHPDAELISLGEQMKALLPSHWEAKKYSHEQYELTCDLAGWNDESVQEAARQSDRGHAEYIDRFQQARKKTDYDRAYKHWCDLGKPLSALAEAALQSEPTTVEGYGVLAGAALYETLPDLNGPEAHAVLARLALKAGFEFPQYPVFVDNDDDDDDDE